MYIQPLGIYMVYTWYIPTIYLIGVPDAGPATVTESAWVSGKCDLESDLGPQASGVPCQCPRPGRE